MQLSKLRCKCALINNGALRGRLRFAIKLFLCTQVVRVQFVVALRGGLQNWSQVQVFGFNLLVLLYFINDVEQFVVKCSHCWLLGLFELVLIQCKR